MTMEAKPDDEGDNSPTVETTTVPGRSADAAESGLTRWLHTRRGALIFLMPCAALVELLIGLSSGRDLSVSPVRLFLGWIGGGVLLYGLFTLAILISRRRDARRLAAGISIAPSPDNRT